MQVQSNINKSYTDQQAAYEEALRIARENNIRITLEKDPNKQRIQYVKSPKDIDWAHPLHEQLWPQLSGHPTIGKPESDFRLLRKKIPLLTKEVFYELFHSYQESSIEVVNPKNDARHYLDLKEAAAWILAGVKWFNVLEQPMMIVVWTKDWPDAAKFQYLLQILEVSFKDYIPKWQIFVARDDDFRKIQP